MRIALILIIVLNFYESFGQSLTLRDSTFVATRSAVAAGGGGSSTLLTGILSYWKLNEGSGNSRLDSAGSGNTLSEVGGGLASAGGILGNSVQIADPTWLSRADNAVLSCNATDFTFAGWFYLDPGGFIFFPIIAKSGNTGSASTEYAFFYDDSQGGLIFQIGLPGGGGYDNLVGTTVSSSAWHFFVVGRDGSNIKLRIDDSGSTYSAGLSGGVQDLANAFTLGDYAGLGTTGGRIDEIGFWKRVLTGAEQTELYNAGAGKTYPF
jgi:hypothetical protein